MEMNKLSLAKIACLVALLQGMSSSEEWNQFRGASGSGVASEGVFPTRWSDQSGIAWVTELSGRGNSSPAITRNRIDITTQTEDQSLWLLSFDRRTGRQLLKLQLTRGNLTTTGAGNLYEHRHNAATPTPVGGENHAWVFFGTGELFCVDIQKAHVLWKRNLTQDFGSYDITFGMASSPRVWKNLLYVACMTKGDSYVVALDKLTGKDIWYRKRDFHSEKDGRDGYSTPVIAANQKRVELLVSGSDHIDAYDLLTGNQNWFSSGLSVDSPFGRVIASPVISGNRVVAISANPGGAGLGRVLGIRAGGSGNITDTHREWSHERSTPDSSSPVIVDNQLFLITDSGIASSLNIKNGSVNWTKRLSPGPYHASLVAGNGRVYYLGIQGNCTVLSAAQDGTVIAVNQLSGTFYATPALGYNHIYLRAYERLYAIENTVP